MSRTRGIEVRTAWWLIWGLVAAAVLLLYVAAAWFADLNQDEGWYLYAGMLVSEGKLPFIDFASTQGPLMSLVYGLAHPVVTHAGLLGGRLFTACLGLGSVALAAWLAARLVGRERTAARNLAAFLVVVFCGLSLYQVVFTTTVKTYALTALLILGGVHCLVPGRGGAPHVVRTALAGLLLAAATATRSSAFALMPVVGLWLLLPVFGSQARRLPALAPVAGFVGGGLVGAVVFFGPFILFAWKGLLFGLVEYHAGRAGGEGFTLLAYKAGFILRVVGNYLPAFLLLLWLVATSGSRRSHGRGAAGMRPVLLLWACVGAVTLLHLAAPFPYDDYQVIIYPLACVGLAHGVASRVTADRTAGGSWMRFFVGVGAAVVLLCHSLTGSILQEWFVGPRDRIWWPIKTETPVQKLRRVAHELHAAGAHPGEVLLTQDAYLAVECGMRLPEGLALGPFSLFPELDADEAAALHVVNLEMLENVLGGGEAEFAAFSGYGLSIYCPQVSELPVDEQDALWERVKSRFDEFRQEPQFGQAYTTLHLMRRKPGSHDAR